MEKKISQMLNLGPVVESDLLKVGITSPKQIIELGAKKTFIQMLVGRIKAGRGAKCCNAVYLYAIYGAIHNIHWNEIPEEKKNEFKQFTKELRKSGRFS